MATWWDERESLVRVAVAVVRAQSRCTHAEAIALLRRRAEVMDTDLEAAARAVIDLGTGLGHRDLARSYMAVTEDAPVATRPVAAI
jgi:hypothetical protein